MIESLGLNPDVRVESEKGWVSVMELDRVLGSRMNMVALTLHLHGFSGCGGEQAWPVWFMCLRDESVR
jgi:hypothetical protein